MSRVTSAVTQSPATAAASVGRTPMASPSTGEANANASGIGNAGDERNIAVGTIVTAVASCSPVTQKTGGAVVVEAAVPDTTQHKKTYTFGMYKATKIAMGLKKKRKPLAGSVGSPSPIGDFKNNRGDAPATTVSAKSARLSLDLTNPFSKTSVSSTPLLPIQTGPWYHVEDPMPWTGPAVPVCGVENSVEPFMVARAKTVVGGLALLPWEGVEFVGPEMAKIIDHGLVELNVCNDNDRPCTKHLPEQNKLHHMRRAVHDALQTPLFSFALFIFEGAATEPAVACDLFLLRLLKGCGGVVYCSITDKPGTAKAYAQCVDSKLTGAALFLRCFLLRFAKRFPQQHGFVHPTIDAPQNREKLIETLGNGFQSFEFMAATNHVPAAIVVRMTNAGAKALCKAPQPSSWIAVNHFYEFCITQPSHALSGHPSIFIIDLGKLSMMQYTSANITAIAGQLIAAMFHPEPFSAFVVAHAPSVFQFVWGIAKFFLTESARHKFVILNGSASSHFHGNLGVPLGEIPEAVGGKKTEVPLITAHALLRLRTQDAAVTAYRNAYGPDIKNHAPASFLALTETLLPGSDLFGESPPGTPTGGGSPGGSTGWACSPSGGDAEGEANKNDGNGASGEKMKRKGSALLVESAKKKKDLKKQISSLAGKLVAAGVVSVEHEAARDVAVHKLKDMRRELLKIWLWQVVLLLLAVTAACGVAWYAFRNR